MSRIPFGPVKIDILDNRSILEKINEFVRLGNPSHAVTLNALMFNEALRNKELADIISNASLITPDSSGIVWAVKYLYDKNISRFTGIDLLNHICAIFSGSGNSVFFLGGAPAIAERAAENLLKIYPGLKVAGTHHGYFTPADEESVITLISEKAPDVLFVGLDMPRQEVWISKNLSKFNACVTIGVGGSFDVLSGELSRAPAWMRVMHLEWLFRLCMQPWRIKRMIGLPYFVLNVIRLKHA